MRPKHILYGFKVQYPFVFLEYTMKENKTR